VRVGRFEVARPRSLRRFVEASDRAFDRHRTAGDEAEWFRENGPDVPGLIEYLRDHGRDYDLVLFWTFRYAPSWFGLPLVEDRAVLVPTAEEDPVADFASAGAFFRRPRGFVFLTEEERAMVAARAGGLSVPSTVVGTGLDPASPVDERVLAPLGLAEPFVLYVGRVDRNKGCETLLSHFERYLARGGPEVTLVLAGPVHVPVPPHPRIRALGYVTDAVRDALLARARALVMPSPYESLCIAVLEGWNRALPALVNGHCAVLRGQVRRADGGLYYRTSDEFAAALSWLLDEAEGARTLGRQGLAYVEREYRWPTVMARVEQVLAQVAGR
jgi:glycosyltransferase involved in cell wall biosynthesis